MGLVHKIPNVDGAIGLADENDTRSSRAPTAACVMAAFGDEACEQRGFNICFPNTKVVIIDCQNYVLVTGK